MTCVIVGADRIAANGDVANKIGTYGLALAARAHRVPFYVAAPTLDGRPRDARTARRSRSSSAAPTRWRPGWGDSRREWNPAFDVTPAALVTAIITDRGVFEPTKSRVAGRESRPPRLATLA